MEKLNASLAKVEEDLGRSELYEADNKPELMKFLDQQATLKSQIEDEEMQWLDAQEQLEAAKDAYDISA